jgi:hypothetical protein
MTDRAQRIALWIVALLLVVGTGLALRFARGYRPLAGLSSPGSPLPADVGVRFDGITVVGRHKNRPAWTLTAGRVDTTRSRSRVEFSGGIRAALLPDKGRPAATIAAPAASYDALSRILQVSGNIVCRAGDLRINTASAQWEAGSNTVRCPGAVLAAHPRGEVRGEQLVVNIRTREYTLRNVRAGFRVDPTEELPL